ncbi:MAG TPA: MFS transporter [Pirellulales bacterium]
MPAASPDPVSLETTVPARSASGQYLVLLAAILGWMFDGLEMGLFPLVARPALLDMMISTEQISATAQASDPAVKQAISQWFDVITACFLVGAATGGVVFGWLGDRIGRVRSMTLSVVVYSVFTGLCGLAERPEQMALFRFIASLGMGGEWALGVALVMEVWKVQSRGLLAGMIGAAANVGYLIIGVVSLGLTAVIVHLKDFLVSTGTSQETIDWLTRNDGWRILMLIGATPALLAMLVRLFVPESESWEKEHAEGRTSHWATQDLLAVVFGACGPGVMIWLLAYGGDVSPAARVGVIILALGMAGWGYIFPVWRYLGRSEAAARKPVDAASSRQRIVGRMMLAAGLSGIALVTTWGCVQRLPGWADFLAEERLKTQLAALGDSTAPEVQAQRATLQHDRKTAKAHTQIWSAIGAIVGTLVAALAGDALGRRVTYILMCFVSLASIQFVFRVTEYGPLFLFASFVAGACTASFYGWLPLYLPELFPTRIRATGQGFGFNFGRILAAVGGLQFSVVMAFLGGSESLTALWMSLIYLLGVPLVMFAPETRGLPLPD